MARNSAMRRQVQDLLRKFTAIQKHGECSTFEWKHERMEMAVVMNPY